MAAAFLDLDLLLDIRGLQFCLARHLRDFKGSTRWDFYGKSLQEGFDDFGLNLHLDDFKPWSSSIKPYLRAKATLDWLRAKGQPLNFLSFVEKYALEDCLSVLKQQGLDLEPIHYVTKETLLEFANEHRHNTFVIADEDSATMLKEHELQAFHVLCPGMKGGPESIQSIEEFFSINEELNKDSYSSWKGYIQLSTPVRVAGEVVRGFGRGSSQIGFPTANLSIVEELDILPGIYSGRAIVELDAHDHQTYPAAISVGWNPQFDNEKLAIEAHIIHKFTEPLYSRRVILELTHYLRAETVFRSVEELIEAIGYDVRATVEHALSAS
mmetsp:Transcript_4815/g.8986  ORF Transcript_4815/g.8986 Transcript_4815/m.8986 type:complete len:325 (-) Transcript_4815:458-1432(-)